MENGSRFYIKDVKVEFKIDHARKSMIFSLSSTKNSDYEIYEIRLRQSKVCDQDVITLQNEFSTDPVGIYFWDGTNFFSPQDVQYILRHASIQISKHTISLSQFKGRDDASLSSSLDHAKFPTKLTKWFRTWVLKKASNKIKRFVYSSVNSLVSSVDFNRLEKQSFFLSVFARNNWSNMHKSSCMKVIDHKCCGDVEEFKKTYALPIARKCLMYSSVMDNRIVFNPANDSARKFLNFMSSGSLLKYTDDDGDGEVFYYDDWKTFLVKSYNPKKLAMLERAMEHMKANFSYCYIKSFCLISEDAEFDSSLDLRTAMCIAEAIDGSRSKSSWTDNEQRAYKVFRETYQSYKSDKNGTIPLVCAAYPKYNGETKSRAQIMRSMPLYSTAWSSFLEKTKFKKENKDSLFNLVLDDEF